ncbi:hypothetical protein T12_13580 [Trichinella patagoniensis]|uniref:Uncharacterized protein n=1 Tax=Trichinella patagoniensis TaxID=990121 RepID=A0A0V0Z1B7_9BILA|nr:hypothetical protein T12_13580 [Trichinella patagoniensis]
MSHHYAVKIIRKTIAYEQLEWRWRESKIPSTKIENHFSRHCVRNIMVPDLKLVNNGSRFQRFRKSLEQPVATRVDTLTFLLPESVVPSTHVD